MNFFIPALGTRFKLTNFWEFLLYEEYRNLGLSSCVRSHPDDFQRVKLAPTGYQKTGFSVAIKFVLPPKTVLGVDRIYIRSSSKEFDSITMKIYETTHPFVLTNCTTTTGKLSPGKSRFWVKLCDFNRIEAEVIKDTVFQHKYL